MSDLSQPMLPSLSVSELGFVWPTPDLPGFPEPTSAPPADLCEVEGHKGQTTLGKLTLFDPERSMLLLRTAGARTSAPLRFEQFRRLRLQTPLEALPGQPGLGRAQPVGVRVLLRGGKEWSGTTVGHRVEPFGLFLFEPIGDGSKVRRMFFPRPAYDSFEIGAPIGETLVAEALATPEQVKAALDEQQAMRQRKLGDILVVKQLITPEELAEAIERQARMPMVRIGEALTGLGLVTEEQLQEALQFQREDRSVPLGELMVRKGLVTRPDLQTALARKMGYPLVDVNQFAPDPQALSRLPYAVAARIPALPLMAHGGRLVVAVEDPSNRRSVDEIEFAAQTKVVPVLARTGTLGQSVDRAYQKIGAEVPSQGDGDRAGAEPESIDARDLLASLEQGPNGEGEGADDGAPAIEQSDNSLVRLINSMILEAKTQGVSDIHIECPPGREKVRIRFRRDGQMRPYLELPHNYRAALIARLKIMCDLDISERRKPQDGKINFGKFVAGVKLELRVATIPTFGGAEDAVLRLLASAKPLPLDDLGLSPANLARFRDAVQRPNGMVLCVGPTGSGKTTTLHSAMGFINTPERKIWTAEDPVEITQAGLRQVQVNPRIGWTFAGALRSFLRADPDVIMVGEIRDKETAQCAVEASLTGHLVMSTLHTNSAPETVTRLLDMGMDPFNFADALLLVLAQRLVRRLCKHCKRAEDATPQALTELADDYRRAFAEPEQAPSEEALLAQWRERFGAQGRMTLYKPVGCPQCDGTGYRGRAGIHEMMGASRDLRKLVQTGARVEELMRAAQADGLRTLRQDGIEKVLSGVTTIDEVRANS